jgi:hypothetical protein
MPDHSIFPAVPGYCRCAPTVCPALLQITRLVNDQHRLGVAELPANELADVGADRATWHRAAAAEPACTPAI